MDISELLSTDANELNSSETQPRRDEVTHLVASAAHNKRKRPYRMSITQQLRRRQHETHESRVFNLTLDINQLKQQVQYLMECRDLHLTRLFLRRQQFEGGVLIAAEKLVKSFSGRGLGLTANERSSFFSRQRLKGLDSGGGTHQLVLERGTHLFSHRTWTITSTRVLYFVEDTEDDEGGAAEAAETRRLCGDSDGCVVETAGIFSGRIKRELLAGFFPHVLHDQELVGRLIGFRLTVPAQLILYFGDDGRITHQVAQVNLLASLDPLREARQSDYAALMGSV